MEAMYPAVADPCSRSPTYQMCTWVCLCVWGGGGELGEDPTWSVWLCLLSTQHSVSLGP